MTLTDGQRAMLWYFAVKEVGPKGSLDQMKAVCYCLRNRARAGWFEGNWIAIIEHADEASAHDPQPRSYINIENRPTQMLLRDIDDIYFAQTGPSDAFSGYALNSGWDGDSEAGPPGSDLAGAIGTKKYYAWLNRPMREWFIENVVRRQPHEPDKNFLISEPAQMGTMMFYE